MNPHVSNNPQTETVVRTSCGICEASCGISVHVRDNSVVSIRPDSEHPNSRGFTCSKGALFHHIVEDPDRVREPLRRREDGSFEPVGWDEALNDIAARLRKIIRDHGSEAVGLYGGNPIVWNYAALSTLFGMVSALKTRNFYLAASTDVNNYYVVNQLLYGNNFANTFPDIARTRFLVVLGSNPVVSHGSMVTVGHIREVMLDITRNGGRVVVIDPRRTETAELFEYQPIRPDSDPWLMAGMVKVAFDENLVRTDIVNKQAVGVGFLRELVADISMERVTAETGIPAEAIAQLTRDFCKADGAAFYCRWGASLGQFSTLTKYFIEAFNLITGNFDRAGGSVFGHSMIDSEKMLSQMGLSGYNRWRSRVEGFPEVLGTAPLSTMAAEIETPGKGQMRALFVSHGNPVISGPAGQRLEQALAKIDLLVSMDPYLTETSRLAHYVLPPTLWLEREGFPIFTMVHTAVPYAQWSDAVLTPPKGVREDWWIMNEICRRSGIVPSPFPFMRMLGKLGITFKPVTLTDAFLRMGKEGDWFGLRPKGLSRAKLVAAGRPIKLMDHPPTGTFQEHIAHRDRLVHLEHEQMRSEVKRLIDRKPDPAFPLRIISIRELRSHNSWMHNSAKLMAGDRVQRLRVNSIDAKAHGIRNGDRVRVESATGSIEVMAWLTDEVMPGVLGLPSGWGHRGGWRRANAAGGASFNDIASSAAADVDQPSGQAHLTGIAVRIRRVARANDDITAN